MIKNDHSARLSLANGPFKKDIYQLLASFSRLIRVRSVLMSRARTDLMMAIAEMEMMTFIGISRRIYGCDVRICCSRHQQ